MARLHLVHRVQENSGNADRAYYDAGDCEQCAFAKGQRRAPQVLTGIGTGMSRVGMGA